MKNIYYKGKLYKVENWDFEKNRPANKKPKKIVEVTEELEKPLEADLEA